MKTIKQQTGVSLIELLISMALGIFVVGGVLTIYLSVTKSSADTLKQSRLNAEMSAIMNIMANDIRRAGYWELDVNTDGTFTQTELDVYQPDENPFSQVSTTALNILDSSSNVSATPTNTATASNVANCILYTYDSNRNGSVDAGEGFGFRQEGVGIQMRTGGAGTTGDCTLTEWEDIVDTNLIEIQAFDASGNSVDGLSFDMSNSQCINSSEPNEADDNADGTTDENAERNCYYDATAANWADADTDEATTEIREIIISLSARLVDDTAVNATMRQTVRVRNDLIRVR